MKARFAWLLVLLFPGILFSHLWAAGSGLNVVVIINQNSSNSVALGNYYCEQRQVPPQNLLRISWPGNKINWSKTEFETVLFNPFVAMMAARQLTNQIDYVLLSMDIPYRGDNPGTQAVRGTNSTTSMLFYGFKPDYPPVTVPPSCSFSSVTSNSYANSEGLFRVSGPAYGNGGSIKPFLATMITATNLAEAKLVVDRGVGGDNTFPTQTVYLAKSDDYARNIRYSYYDNVVFNTRIRGNYSVQRTNVNWSNYLGPILGYENGYQNSIPGHNYVPGALADQLTSFSGQIFEQSDHTTALNYLLAGAVGSYGTIIEPCGYVQKFPNPLLFFYQSRGFTMGECYYMAVDAPYQGLTMGEPLSAPFARPPLGNWTGLPADAILGGVTNLTGQFSSSEPGRLVQGVDFFVDGVFAQTVTNIPPWTNNVLYVTVNGYSTNYTVPAGATLRSIASNLTTRLMVGSFTNVTKILTTAYGDRLELQSMDTAKLQAQQLSLMVSNAIGTAPALTAFLSTTAGNGFWDSVANGIRLFAVNGNSPAVGAYLMMTIAKTNGTNVVVAITNTVSGTTLPVLAQTLVGLINTEPALQDVDGVVAEDFVPYDPLTGLANPQFNLRPRSAGWAAARMQATFTASAGLSPQPSATVQRLDANLNDLRPRAHIYVTAGVTNLPVNFAFNTTTQANGFHELTAVAYEGSHVRTQKRITQRVFIQNGPLSAAFTTLFGGSNTLLSATLQFSVVANTNAIAKIELFGNGGSLGSVTSQSSAVFSVAGTNVGLGLQPFHAIITATSGAQYRTETKWIRLVNQAEMPFQISATASPPTLTWPATVGRSYDILGTTNVALPFVWVATVTPGNSPAVWTDTNASTPRFYRIQVAD